MSSSSQGKDTVLGAVGQKTVNEVVDRALAAKLIDEMRAAELRKLDFDEVMTQLSNAAVAAGFSQAKSSAILFGE
jgi:stalled ribosome rescue protein Dom34